MGKKRQEEETARKFGLSGFGAFGADPFGYDDDEEEEEQPAAPEKEEPGNEGAEWPQDGGEEQLAGGVVEGEEKTESSSDQTRVEDNLTDTADDEGVELIAEDEDSHHDSTFSYQDTIAEEEEPAEDTGVADGGDSTQQSNDQVELDSSDEAALKREAEERKRIDEEE